MAGSKNFEVVPLKIEHVSYLLSKPQNHTDKNFFPPHTIPRLEGNGFVTGLMNGVPAICGGVVEYWEGRGYAWCLFNPEIRQEWITLFRAIDKYLKEILPRYNRIEVCVPLSIPVGHRRVTMLGFVEETARAKRFLPDGQDCSIYVLFGRKGMS